MTPEFRSEAFPDSPRRPRYSRTAEVRLLVTECVRDFMKNLISRKWSVCTFWPTPEEMSQAMIEELHLKPNQSVLELGSGTGPVTAALDKYMPEGCTSLSIELNPRLCRFSQARLPHMNIVHGNAMDLAKHMDASGMTEAHGVISGLPFPSLPEPVIDGILSPMAEMLTPDAVITQITALGREKYKELYGQYFEQVTFFPVPHFPYPKGGFYKLEGLKKAA